MHGSLLARRRCNWTSQLVGGTVVGCPPQGDCLTLWICAKCLFNKAERIFTEERSPSRRRWAALLMLVGWYRAQQWVCSAHLCLTACYACTENHISSWGQACVCTWSWVHDHVHDHSPVLSFLLSGLRTCSHFPEKPHTLDLHGLEAGLGRPSPEPGHSWQGNPRGLNDLI